MARNKKITFELDAENTRLKRKLDETQRKLDDTGKKGLKAFKMKLALGIGFAVMAFRKLISVGIEWIGLSDEQLKASAKVEQAIKQTAGAAGLSAEKLKEVARGLQEITAIGDEKILNQVTAQLLTFTNITGDNFLRTQKLALDLATVLDGDLKSASIQLGKALNDPVANLSALSRSGIQFSKEQKEVIKTLTDQNRLYEAQGIILTEIERQYGGQAKAVADATGQITKITNKIGDFKEKLGGLLKGALIPIFNWLGRIVDGLDDLFNSLNPAESELQKLTKAAQEQKTEFLTLAETYKILAEKTELTKVENELYQETITALQTLYPNYLKNIDLEKDSYEDVRDALAEAGANLDAYLEKKVKLGILQLKENELIEIGAKLAELERERIKIQAKLQAEIQTAYQTGIFQGIAYEDRSQLEKAIQYAQKGAKVLGKIIRQELEEEQGKIREIIIAINNSISGMFTTDPGGKGGKGSDAAVEKVKKAVKDIKESLSELPQAMETATAESTSILDDWARNFQEKANILEGAAASIGSGFVRGFDVEGLKGALKNVLTMIVDYLERLVLAGQVGAGARALLGDPSALFQIVAITAAFEAAKLAISSFAVGVEGFEGGMARVHKDETVYLPPGTNVHTKTDTKHMLNQGNGQTNRLLMDILKTLQTQKLSTRIKGYDLYVLLERDKTNRLGGN